MKYGLCGFQIIFKTEHDLRITSWKNVKTINTHLTPKNY